MQRTDIKPLVKQEQNENYNEFRNIYNLSNKAELFFSPDRPALHTTKYEKAAAPMLPKAIEKCGEVNIKIWIADNLTAVCELSLAKEKLPFEDRVSLAEVIIDKMKTCNVAEILLFFYKAITGDFGKIYRADMSEIGALVNEYKKWLSEEKDRLDREQEPIHRAKRQAELDKAWEESDKLMGKNKLAWAKAEIERRRKLQQQI